MAGKALPRWTDLPIYLAIRAAMGTLQVFPPRQNIRTMRGIGGAWGRARFNRARLQRAIDNIAWCFPNWSPERVEHAAVESYKRLFALGVETIYTPRLISRDGWVHHVRLGDFGDALERMVRGGPTLLVTGHSGNWEILGYALARLGFSMHALYRPLDLKPLDRWLRDTRAGAGLELLDKFGAGHRMPEILRKGEPVAFIADQNAGDRGLFVPFFDRLASTYKSIGLLALRYDAPIVCGGARAIASNPHAPRFLHGEPVTDFHYEFEVTDIIYPEEWKTQDDPLFYVTARYRRAIELTVKRSPEQYLWMHRYWKSRPAFEQEGKPMPARLREKIAALPWMTEESLARIEASGRRSPGA